MKNKVYEEINLADPPPICCFSMSSNNLLPGKKFFDELYFATTSGYLIDVITYTLNKRYLTSLAIGRVIVGTPQLSHTFTPERLRHVSMCHVKAYLFYPNRKAKRPSVAWVGSLNLVTPTHYDILARVEKKRDLTYLADFFEMLWNQGTSCYLKP